MVAGMTAAVQSTFADQSVLQPPTEEAATLASEALVQYSADMDISGSSALPAALAQAVPLGLYLPDDTGSHSDLKPKPAAVSNEPSASPAGAMAVSAETYVPDSQPAAGDYRMPRQALLPPAGATSQVGMLFLGMDLDDPLVDLLAGWQAIKGIIPLTV